MIRTLWMPLALAGCLLVDEAPPGAKVNLDCVDTGCRDGFACDPFYDRCAFSCDSSQPCQAGYVCIEAGCVATCQDGDCDHHLGCASETECRKFCNSKSDCASFYACCTNEEEQSGACHVVGNCFAK